MERRLLCPPGMNLKVAVVGWVLFVGCGQGVWTSSEDPEGDSHGALAQPFRVVAGNLTSGAQQSYDPGHGARIFAALHPDLVLLQEFNATDVPGFVRQTFGEGFGYVRGTPIEQIPNGVVSRYPIKASGTWADPKVNGTRGFTWALVDVPGEPDVFAVSVHLSTTTPATRDAEAASLVAHISATAPRTAWVVIGGDFNTSTRTEPALTTLARVVSTSPPWPADSLGNSNTNASRGKPYDWVLVSPGLQARQVPTVIGAQRFANGLVVDTRQFKPLAQLPPALVGDSAATAMQHMAVVRDFQLGR
jgi:endonuclease/exonuclease/phosphatase family metal-dependent hydrolase